MDMHEQREPPTLDYRSPVAPKSSPWRRVISLFGFFIFGGIGLLCCILLIDLFGSRHSSIPMWTVPWVFVLEAWLTAFFAWRALKAFREFLR